MFDPEYHVFRLSSVLTTAIVRARRPQTPLLSGGNCYVIITAHSTIGRQRHLSPRGKASPVLIRTQDVRRAEMLNPSG
jgi:hypothetical protein